MKKLSTRKLHLSIKQKRRQQMMKSEKIISSNIKISSRFKRLRESNHLILKSYN